MLVSAILQSIIETIAFFMRIYNHPIALIVMPIEYLFYGLTFLFLIMHFEYYLDFHYIPTFLSILFLVIIETTSIINLKYDLVFFLFNRPFI